MNSRKIFNAIVMVTGTSVGSGILGLPIITSSAGFLPTMVAFIVAWIFMTMGAFYILDIKMQVRGSFNLSSLIKLTLGRPGQYVSSIMIALLLYALLCTYMMAGSAWLNVFIAPVVAVPQQLASVLFTILLGGLVLCGERLTYNLNNLLGVGLLLAFIATVGSSMTPSNYDFIKQGEFQAILPSLPLILTTFGFSIVVPALTEYLDYQEKSIKTAIIFGSLVALAAYDVWEWVTLGNISSMSFQTMKQSGDNGTGVIVSLAQSTQSSWVTFSGRLFAVFAVITSFLGVSLALLHFLSDVLTLKLKGKNRLILFFLAYLPPILVTSFYPRAFVQILSFAGIFVAVLLGLFPAVMVLKKWCKKVGCVDSLPSESVGRVRVKRARLFVLIGVIVFFGLVIVQEIINLL